MYNVEYCYNGGYLKDALKQAIEFILYSVKDENKVVSLVSVGDDIKGWTVIITYEI